MKRRKAIASLIALVLTLSMLGTAVLAGEYDIGQGAITVSVDHAGKQTVQQGEGEAREDSDPVTIFGTSTNRENNVIISVADGQHAEVTFRDVNMQYDNPVTSLVHIETAGNNTSTTLNFEGTNKLLTVNSDCASISASVHGKSEVILHGEDGSSVKTSGIMLENTDEADGDATLSLEGMNVTDTRRIQALVIGDDSDVLLSIKDSNISTGTISSFVSGYANVDGSTATAYIEDSTVTCETETVAGIQAGVISYNGGSAVNSKATVTIKNSDLDVKVGDTDVGRAVSTIARSNDTTTSLSISDCDFVDSTQKVASYEKGTGETAIFGYAVCNQDGSVATATKLKASGKPGPGPGPGPGPEPEPTAKQIGVTLNADGTFTIKGATLKQFARLKVDGKTLGDGDFTLTEEDSALKLTFSDAFLASLSAGAHTAEIVFGDSYALFTITK